MRGSPGNHELAVLEVVIRAEQDRLARDVPSLIRRTEALAYAIGIDAGAPQHLERIGGRVVDGRALRELTNDSGGRTEIILDAEGGRRGSTPRPGRPPSGPPRRAARWAAPR